MFNIISNIIMMFSIRFIEKKTFDVKSLIFDLRLFIIFLLKNESNL